eukprot:gene1645-33037_t
MSKRRPPSKIASCPDLSDKKKPWQERNLAYGTPIETVLENSEQEQNAESPSLPTRGSRLRDTLLLAPILARRLDVPGHVGRSVASSRSSSNSRSSPRVSNEGTRHKMCKLPALLRNLEGTNQGGSPLVGSSNLSQVAKDSAGSPAGFKTPLSHNFDMAKIQVNRDLEAFRADASTMAEKLEGMSDEESQEKLQLVYSPHPAPNSPISLVLLTLSPPRAFDIVRIVGSSVTRGLQVTSRQWILSRDRSEIFDPVVKGLFTRLLFILSRCSRLLITEQLNLYATEPRNNRYAGTNAYVAPPALFTQKNRIDDDIYRSHTVPVREMEHMSRKIQFDVERNSRESQVSGVIEAEGASEERSSGQRSSDQRSSDQRPSRLSLPWLEKCEGASSTPGTSEVNSGRNSASDPDRTSATSCTDSPTGDGSQKKKKKGLFKQMKSNLKSTLDNFKKKMKSNLKSTLDNFKKKMKSNLKSTLDNFKKKVGKEGKSPTSTSRNSSSSTNESPFVGSFPQSLTDELAGDQQAGSKGPRISLPSIPGLSKAASTVTSPTANSGKAPSLQTSVPRFHVRFSNSEAVSPELTATASREKVRFSNPDAPFPGLSARDKEVPERSSTPMGSCSEGGARSRSSLKKHASMKQRADTDEGRVLGREGSIRWRTARMPEDPYILAPNSSSLFNTSNQVESGWMSVSLDGKAGGQSRDRPGGSQGTGVEGQSGGHAGGQSGDSLEVSQGTGWRSVRGQAGGQSGDRLEVSQGTGWRSVRDRLEVSQGTGWRSVRGQAGGQSGDRLGSVGDKAGCITGTAEVSRGQAGVSRGQAEVIQGQAEVSPGDSWRSVRGPAVVSPGTRLEVIRDGWRAVRHRLGGQSGDRLEVSQGTGWRSVRGQAGGQSGDRLEVSQGTGWRSVRGQAGVSHGTAGTGWNVPVPGAGPDGQFQGARLDVQSVGPAWDEPLEPEHLDMLCAICEEQWASVRLEEHSELCAVLQSVAQGMSVDAHLTTLANVIEEQLEMGELSYTLRREISILIRAGRAAASLQPDGSQVPSTRCLAFAAADGINPSDLGESGSSTPRSPGLAQQGMTIDDFDILKPINRGAFGRVGMTEDDFDILKPINRGAFGRVCLA